MRNGAFQNSPFGTAPFPNTIKVTIASGLRFEVEKYSVRLRPEATVIPVWKTPVCKRGACKQGILKHPVFNVLNFRGWIKHIFDIVD